MSGQPPTHGTDVRRQQRIRQLEARVLRIEALCERLNVEAQIQFTRIAELQAELDEMRVKAENVAEWTRNKR
jgi:hypothetical protein